MSDKESILHADLIPQSVQATLTKTLDDLFAEFKDTLREEQAGHTKLEGADRNLGHLRVFAESVVQDVQKRTARLARERNALVAFNRMPPEVISTIFEASIGMSARPDIEETTIDGLRRLSSVCYIWMCVVKTTPTLWTTVGDQPLDVVALKLRKSGNCPLVVYLQRSIPDYRAPTEYCPPIPLDYDHPVIAQFQRWRRLDVYLSNKNLALFRELLKRENPGLSTIRASFDGTTAPPLPIAGGPNLKCLNIMRILVEPARVDSFKTLLSLTFHIPSEWRIECILKLVHLMPVLEFLSVAGDGRPSYNRVATSSPVLPPITIRTLTNLRIINVYPEEAVEALNFVVSPNAAKLYCQVLNHDCTDDLYGLIEERVRTAMKNSKVSHLDLRFSGEGSRVSLQSPPPDPNNPWNERPLIYISLDINKSRWMARPGINLPPLHLYVGGGYIDPYGEEREEEEYESDDIFMDYDSEVGEIDEESITKDQWDSIKEKKLQKLRDEREEQKRLAAKVPSYVWELAATFRITFTCPLERVRSFFTDLESRTIGKPPGSWPFPNLEEIIIVDEDMGTSEWFLMKGKKLLLETLKRRELYEDLGRAEYVHVYLEQRSYGCKPTSMQVL